MRVKHYPALSIEEDAEEFAATFNKAPSASSALAANLPNILGVY